MTDHITPIDDLFDIQENKDTTPCKGLFYRCKINNFWNDNGHHVTSHRMVPLRRKSCKGCDQCYFLLCDENRDCLIEPNDVIHDAIYRLGVTNKSIDIDGYCDDWNIEFLIVESESTEKNEPVDNI